VKEAFNFVRGKLDITGLEFHYLKIGKAAPLYDGLSELSAIHEIKWINHEADSFQDYHFGASYAEFDGAVINLGLTDENVADMRRGFWEEFIWKTGDMPLLVAVVIPDTSSFGSLSRSQVQEALALVRLTDRPFKIFEHTPMVVEEVFGWLTSHASIVHRLHREPEEDKKE
jgi:hypothetical protein